MRRLVVIGLLSLLFAVSARADGIEKLSPPGGVKIGRITYVKGDTRHDPLMDRAISRALGVHGLDIVNLTTAYR